MNNQFYLFIVTILFLISEFAIILGIIFFPKLGNVFIGIGMILAIIYILKLKKKSNLIVAKYINFAGLKWTINDFCRGVLITGQTGSGKTACAMRNILYALFRDVPNWGGAVVDLKGQFYEIVLEVAKRFKSEDKLIILRVDDTEQVKIAYNLLSYPNITFENYASLIVDTAESIGTKVEAGFWRENTINLITAILKCVSVERQPTLSDIHHYILHTPELKLIAQNAALNEQQEIIDAAETVNSILNMAAATRDSIIATVKSITSFFSQEDINKVFSPETNTIDFRDIDKGKIFIISMSQKYSRERTFYNAFLKLLFAQHAIYRFDSANLKKKNLIVFMADEAQEVVTASEARADHKVVGIIREARATYILATQSLASFKSKLKAEDVNTLILNLATQIHFTVADQDSAEQIAKTLGVKEIVEEQRSVSKQGVSTSYKDIEKTIYSPAVLRRLKKYECVIKHPNNETKKMFLPPVDCNGRIPFFYYKDRFGIFARLFYFLQF